MGNLASSKLVTTNVSYFFQFLFFSALIGGILVAFEWCCCQVCCAGCVEMSCYMGALLLAGAVNIMFACELCVGIGFDSVTAEGIEAATQDGNLCEIGPGCTLNAITVIIYLILCILLCW